jgi:diguanylate cyclase (GGDEF)-like protein
MRLSVLQSQLGSVVATRGPQTVRLKLPRMTEKSLSLIVALTGVILCGWSALALRGDLLVADGISYFCYAISLAFCGAVCVPFARREYGVLRLRWILFSGSCFALSLCFAISAMTRLTWLSFTIAQFYEIWLHALSGSMILMAAIVFFSRSSRTMAALDTVQAQLFGMLHFGLIFGPKAADLFAANHLLVSTLVALFLFITAATASVGAASRAESRFLRLLTLFLGLQCVATFLMNQVSYVWLHYDFASIWDVPETMFNMIFALLAIRAFYRPESNVDVRPTVTVRSLMPSFLALGNLALGLVVMLYYPVPGVMAVIFAVTCFAMRMVLLQALSGREQNALRERNRQLEDIATRDTLTGVGNRRSLTSALSQLILQGSHDGLALVLVDTDWFKQANDFHGHQYGDAVLVAIADVLSAATRGIRGGHCARLGGDEFALLLPDLDFEEARTFAEGIRLRVTELSLKAGERTISISLGVTVSTLPSELSFEDLMNQADEALYRAKFLGRNRVELSA